MSRSLGTNSGSRDSLNCRTRCGWRPCERQMRCTAETLIRTSAAIAAAVQCVVSPGGSLCVSATTRSPMAGARGGTRDGRVLSCNRPSTPSCMNRSCQRHRQVLLLPVRRMISLVADAIPGQQHDPCSPHVFLRAVAIRDDRFKTATIGGIHIDDDCGAHPTDSHVRVPTG